MAGTAIEPVKIFFSHKKEDAKLAEFIKERLLFYGGERLEFTMFEQIPAGQDWRTWIIEEVGSAKLLLFLAPRPNADFSWCTYETGIFETGNEADTTKRVVFLHGESVDIPDPLKPLQAVKANLDEMKVFLRQLFGTSEVTGVEPPIHPRLANDDAELSQLAMKICEAIGPTARPAKLCNRWIILHVPDPKKITPRGLPGGVTVTGSESSFQIFGRAQGDVKWDQLIDEIVTDGRRRGIDHTRWVSQLVGAIHAANHDRLVPPVQAAFRAHDNNVYLPVLTQVDDEGDHDGGPARRFHVIFVEQRVSGSVRMPDRFSSLLSSLTLGIRLEFDVCAYYLEEDDEWLNDPQRFEEVRPLIGAMIDGIETEGRARRDIEMSSAVKTDRLVAALQPDGEAEQVESNLRAQEKLKKVLAAGEASDAESLRQTLAKLRVLNHDVLLRTAARYSQLLENRFHAGTLAVRGGRVDRTGAEAKPR